MPNHLTIQITPQGSPVGGCSPYARPPSCVRKSIAWVSIHHIDSNIQPMWKFLRCLHPT